MSTAITLKTHIKDLVADLSPSVVPTTTTTAQVNVGAMTVSVNPLLTTGVVSRLAPGGRLSFHDGLGEPLIPIDSVSADGTTITLKRAATIQHASGVKVYSNLLDYSPNTGPMGRMMTLGDPLIGIWCSRKVTPQSGFGNVRFPSWRAYVTYLLQFTQPSDDTRESDEWAHLKEDQCLTDCEAIETTLLTHQTLRTPFAGPIAEQFGEIDNPANLITTEWDYRAREGNIWDFVALMELHIVGTPPGL